MNKLLTKFSLYLCIAIFMISSIAYAHAYEFQVLSTNPAPIEAGEYADITVKIDTFNSGDSEELEKLQFSLKETQDVEPVSGQEFTIFSINSGEKITKTFRVYFSDDLPTGEIPLTLIIKQGLQSIELDDSVFVEKANRGVELSIAQAESTPQDLLQDTKSNSMKVTIQNLGERDAENVQVTLNPQNDYIKESYFYSLRDTISTIPAGSERIAEFTFDVEEISPEMNKLNFNSTLNIQYREQQPVNNSYEINNDELDFQIRLSESPRFEIVSVEPRETLQAGNSGNELEVKVKNVGEEDAKDARLRLYPDPSAPFDFEVTSLFISSLLEENQSATVIVPFDIMESALIQSYNVNADFESLVGSNRYTQSETIPIQVESEATDSLGMYLISLIIITIGGSFIIGYFYNSSRKKSSKKSEKDK